MAGLIGRSFRASLRAGAAVGLSAMLFGALYL